MARMARGEWPPALERQRVLEMRSVLRVATDLLVSGIHGTALHPNPCPIAG